MPAFLPTLRRSVVRRMESKIITPVAFSQYYASVAGLNHTPTRDWPIERAVAEGYDRVIWVFKCVNTIAADSARLPYQLRDGGPDGDVVDDHPLYRVLNKKANPLETGQVFRKRLSAQILLSKRGAFVEVQKSNAGSVIRLDLLPPDRVDIIPGTGADLIKHFRLNRRNGSVKNLDVENVRWFRDPHPIDPYMGTTPLESAGMSVELDHFARLYNVAFMQNDGRPGGVLAVRKTDGEGGDIDPVQMDRIEEKFGKGPQEAGKLSVIAGDLSYVDIAAKPRDMQYGQTSRNAKIEILSGFGVGESVLGYAAERTFDNADNELYVYWTRTMPGHNEILLTGFDEDSEDTLTGEFDTSKVEVLERAAKAKRAEARDEVTAGLRSIYSYATLAGYDDEMDDTPHTRALFIPTGKTPLPSREKDAEALGLGTPVDTGTPPGGGEAGPPALPPGGDGTGPATPQLNPAGSGNTPPAAPGAPGAAPAALNPAPAPGATPGAAAAALAAVAGTKSAPALRAIEGGNPKARAVLRLSRKAAPDPVVTDSAPDEDAAEALERQVAFVLHSLTERWTERAVVRLESPKQRKGTRHWQPEYENDTRVGTKALDTAKAVDEQTWQTEAEEATHPLIEAAAIAAATALLIDLGVTPPPGVSMATFAAQAVAQTVVTVVGMIGRYAASAASRLIADVSKADQQDDADLEGITAVVRRTGLRLGEWAKGVAVQAATATTNAARDDAAREANRDENVEIQREWYSKRDALVRPSHHKADGQIRALDEPFVVGVSLLRFPGDPLAPIHETANCRCKVKHRSRRTGRFVPVGKALPRDADSDGFIYDGTPRQMPAPTRTLRVARRNEPAIARGVALIAKYRDDARNWEGDRLNDPDVEWPDDSTFFRMFDVNFTTKTGRRVGLSEFDVDVAQDEDGVTFEIIGTLSDDQGAEVANFGREIALSKKGGAPTVYHSGLRVDVEAQGEGIASEFNAHAIAFYKENGIHHIGVTAVGTPHQRPRVTPDEPNAGAGGLPTLQQAIERARKPSSNGGYTWGQQGYDFMPGQFQYTLPGRAAQVARRNPAVVVALRQWTDLSHAEQEALLAEFGPENKDTPGLRDVLPPTWWFDAEQRAILIDFLSTVDVDNPPTPYELNQIGREHPFLDKDTVQDTWLGKALMARSSWGGYFDLDWLDAYPEAKALQGHDRERLLAGLFLAALGEDDDSEAKSVRALGHAAALGAAIVEARAFRDGDGDGWIEDGTPRMRRAPIARSMLGRPFSEVQAAERRRRRRSKPPADVKPHQREAWDQSFVIRPGQKSDVGSGTDATLVQEAADKHLTDHGGDPGVLDRLVQLAQSYDTAAKGDDLAAVGDALFRMIDAAMKVLGLTDSKGEPLITEDSIGEQAYAALKRLAGTSRKVPADVTTRQ